MFDGSMQGAGAARLITWTYMISNADNTGFLEVNPAIVAFKIGCTKGEVEEALEYLMAPDPNSRSKANEGRRIIREGQFGYSLVNYQLYRNIANKRDRREYQKDWTRKKAVKKKMSTTDNVAESINRQIRSSPSSLKPSSGIYEVWLAHTGESEVDSGTMNVVNSHIREYGDELVLDWLQSAIRKFPDGTDQELGKWISACRNKYQERHCDIPITTDRD